MRDFRKRWKREKQIMANVNFHSGDGGDLKEWRKQEREKILHIIRELAFFWAMAAQSHSYMDRSSFLSNKNRMTLFYFFLTGPWGGCRAPSSSTCKTAKDIAGWQQLSNVCEDSKPTVWYKMSSSPFSSPTCPSKPVVVLVNTFARRII